MISLVRPEEAVATICSYIQRILEMEEVGLWFRNRETGNLEGRWTRSGAGGTDVIEHSFSGSDVSGRLRETVWHMQTVIAGIDECRSQMRLPFLGTDSAVALIPLVSVRQWLPCKEVKKCIRQECTAYFDNARFCWETGSTLCAHEKGFDESKKQEFCLKCDVFPLLGLLAVKKQGSEEITPNELSLLESVARNISRMLESSRLYDDLEVGAELRQSILDSMGECLLATDLSGRIVAFNRTAEVLSGFDASEVKGTDYHFIIPGDLTEEAPIDRAFLRGAELWSAETLIKRRSGGAIPVKMTTRLLKDEKGSARGVIATFSDLRPARKLEEKMRQLDRLAALGRFSSSVAHELRNPLTGMAAGVQYMARQFGDRGPEADNVRFILREIARLERIVQDLLRITHPQELALSEARMEDVIERALKSLGPALTKKGVSLDLSLKGRIPAASVDVDQMQQVFINLLKNAVEASTDGGSISIEVASNEEGRQTDSTTIAVTVIDTGSGIDMAHLEHIFEPFFTTKPGGTGLGLYITQDIVKRHGGDIVVASEPGKGTSFTVQIPVAAGEARGSTANA